MVAATTAAAGTSLLPPSISKALAIPANRRTGTIKDVEHVVILMQENRSFDHYFGSMRGVRGFADPRPHTLPNGKSVWYQSPAQTKTHLYKSRGLPDDADYVLPFYIDTRETTAYQESTDHGWSSGHLAWNHGKYNAWVNQKQDVLTMGHLKREDINFHYALADAFTLCDAYHCSAHADTAVNRIYLWSGTSDPRNVMGTRPNGPGLSERLHTNGYTWTTYPERLEAHGISWQLYQGGTGEPGTPTDNYTDNALEFFAAYQVAEGADPNGPLVTKGVSNRTLRQLRDDVVQQKLAQVTWVVAPYMYSEHPHATPSEGAYYINQVLEALTANPEVWSKTVLFINYDENDGLFDHVVPPMPPQASRPNDGGMVSANLVDSLRDEFLDLDQHRLEMDPKIHFADPGGLQPVGLGPRVPMLVISPWTKGGWVCSQTFDHTSVLQFLEARFGVIEPNISAWRRAVCGDLTAAFDFANPPDTRVPQIKAPVVPRDTGAPITVPAVQTMPTQEAGVRPARALPYDFTVHGRVEASAGKFWLDITNAGRAGAAFYIYDDGQPESDPRRYAVSAGDTLSDYWHVSPKQPTYDLRVHGPNGYLSQFKGHVIAKAEGHHAALEAQLRHDKEQGRLYLIVTNQGPTASQCTIHNAYAGKQATSYTVMPGATVEAHWELATSAGWYDLTITSNDDVTYLRRFAGHLENGQPATSDPGPV